MITITIIFRTLYAFCRLGFDYARLRPAHAVAAGCVLAAAAWAVA
jgi:hypothetical protein